MSESGRTFLYRAFDADGQLLYVGIAKDLEVRLKDHSRYSVAWIGQVASLTAEKYPSRRAAHAAESRAIRTEGPIYNIHGSPNAESARFLAWVADQARYAKPMPKTEKEWNARFCTDFDEYIRIWRLASAAAVRATDATPANPTGGSPA